MYSEHRAYSILEVEKFDDERRTFSGWATTPTPDRSGDIVEPLGVAFSNPVQLLLHHDKKLPVGQAFFDAPTPRGIRFQASIPKVDEPGILKDRTDEAWQSVKTGVLRGVSIRVRAHLDNVKKLARGGLHWLKSEVTELSLVSIPDNREATIDAVKACDVDRPAASGTEADESRPTSRVRDTVRVVKLTRQDIPMKTYSEQIKEFEATRAATVAERDALQAKAIEEGRSKDAEERTKFEELTEKIASCDAELADLRVLEKDALAAAKPAAGKTPEEGGRSRAGETSIIRVKDIEDRVPGVRFTRYAMCVAAAKGNIMAAEHLARNRYPDDSQMHEVLKAAVAAGTTLDSNWAGNLVQYQNMLNPFIEFLRPMTILGQFGQNGIPALQSAPAKTRFFSETTGGEAYWTGEAKPKALTKGAFGTLTIDFHKVATIAVLTNEEVRHSSPSAEVRVRNMLAKAIASRIDRDFVDPANAGTTNVKPASVTNGVAAIPPSGTGADDFRTDFASLLAPFVSAEIDPTGIVIVMSGSTALALSLMRNTFGTKEFPELSMKGGTIEGLPVIVSNYVSSLGSPGTNMIIAISAPDVFLVDDGQATIDASDQASVEMLDSALQQDATTGTGASLVSLWQNNLLGLRAEREITWKKARAQAVQYISPAAYAA